MWIYIHFPIFDFQDRAFPELASSISQPELFTLQFNPSFSLMGIKALFVRVRIIQGAVIANHIFSSHDGLDKGYVISECFPPYFVYTLVSEADVMNLPPQTNFSSAVLKILFILLQEGNCNSLSTWYSLPSGVPPPTSSTPCP